MPHFQFHNRTKKRLLIISRTRFSIIKVLLLNKNINV